MGCDRGVMTLSVNGHAPPCPGFIGSLVFAGSSVFVLVVEDVDSFHEKALLVH